MSTGPGFAAWSARLAAVAILAVLLLVPPRAEAADLRERIREFGTSVKEFGARVMTRIRKMRGLEPAPKPPAPPPVAEPAPAPPPVATPESVPPAESVPEPPPVAQPAPPPPGITLRANCSGKDESGYTESIALEVHDGEVRQLEARIEVPRRGACRFDLAEFRQSPVRSHLELLAVSGAGCAMRMWEQGGKFVVVATDCPEKCTRGAFEYVWPIEIDVASGACL